MAQLFESEVGYPDNKAKANFVFLGHPHSPPIALDDYRRVIHEIEEQYPIRIWYFLDEITTEEMMRKIWRAILRSSLAIFDISRGNPNVAFELGLAVAQNKNCFTILKQGEPNPLGSSDLGYAERAEYTSAVTLKEVIVRVLDSKGVPIKLAHDLSYALHDEAFEQAQSQIQTRIILVLNKVFANKKITKVQAEKILGNRELADNTLNALREKGVLKVEGQKRGAIWVFSDSWVYHDHEVAGQ